MDTLSVCSWITVIYDKRLSGVKFSRFSELPRRGILLARPIWANQGGFKDESINYPVPR